MNVKNIPFLLSYNAENTDLRGGVSILHLSNP